MTIYMKMRKYANVNVQAPRVYMRPSLTTKHANRGRRVLDHPDYHDHTKYPPKPIPPVPETGLLTAADRAELARRYAKRETMRSACRGL